MLRKILMVVLMLSLFVFPASASAQRFAPLNYCTTVSAVQEQGLATYAVNATGSGRWARIVEYPVASPAVVVAVQDFGAGATSYFFQHVALSPSYQYQVQISHTSATTGFSTSGCVFAPAPLAVVIEAFTATCITNPRGVRLAWTVNTEAFSTHYTVARDGDVILNVPAYCPHCTSSASYSRDIELSDGHGIYTLIVWNGSGLIDVEEAWIATCETPTAVRLGKFSAR